MLKVGMTTVTFNPNSISEVIEYAKAAELSVIEVGGRTHVVAGDLKAAEEMKNAAQKAKIEISSYGSYYRCGTYPDAQAEFNKVIETTLALGASTIRIWVGSYNFEDADEEYKEKIISELRMISDMAREKGIDIGCEFHGGTLCNNRESSLYVCREVARDNFGMYFQYDPRVSIEENERTLREFLPILKNVHVFCITEKAERYFITDKERGGREMWEGFIKILKDAVKSTNILIEFLPNPTLTALASEAEALREITKN